MHITVGSIEYIIKDPDGYFWDLIYPRIYGDIIFHYQIYYKYMHIKKRNKNMERLLYKTQRCYFSKSNVGIGIMLEWIMILIFSMLKFVQINMTNL